MGQITTKWDNARHEHVSTSSDPAYAGMEGAGKTSDEASKALNEKIAEKNKTGNPAATARGEVVAAPGNPPTA